MSLFMGNVIRLSLRNWLCLSVFSVFKSCTFLREKYQKRRGIAISPGPLETLFFKGKYATNELCHLPGENQVTADGTWFLFHVSVMHLLLHLGFEKCICLLTSAGEINAIYPLLAAHHGKVSACAARPRDRTCCPRMVNRILLLLLCNGSSVWLTLLCSCVSW